MNAKLHFSDIAARAANIRNYLHHTAFYSISCFPTMRQFQVLILFLALGIAAAPVSRAQSSDPSDLFLNAYMSVQKAQKMEEEGKYKLALQKYKYAVGLLQQIRDRSPNWQPVIVTYRLNKTSEAIGLLQKKIAVEGTGPLTPDEPPLPENPDDGSGNTATAPPPAPRVDTPTNGSGGGGDAIDEVRADMERMRQELADLKKKNADEERANADLTQKYNDTVKMLDQSRVDESEVKAQLEKAEEDYKNSVADKTKDGTNQKEMQDTIARLQNELKDRDAERDAAQDANDEAEHKIAGLSAARDQAFKERDDAVTALKKAEQGQQGVDKLMADNAALTKKLNLAQKTIDDLNEGNPQKDAQIASLKKDLADANEHLAAALKQSQDNLNAMNDLQDQLEKATTVASPAATGANSEETNKLSEENKLLRGIVKRERNEEAYRDQQKQLLLAELQDLRVPSDSPLVGRVNDLARPMKLTAEERALFRQADVTISDNSVSIAAEIQPGPTSTPASPGPATTPPPSIFRQAAATPPPAATPASTPMQMTSLAPPLPSSAETPAATPPAAPRVQTTIIPPVPEALVPQAKEAKEEFERGHYRESEKIYRTMMEQEPANIYILDNLGVVLFRSGKLKEAEEILRKGLAVTPDDEFTLRTLGIVCYTEGTQGADHNEVSLDDALRELTKALTINPKDAIGHNYLGITASAKGWQEAARKELEAAVAIDPKYADAHFNLAVIYLTTPPVDRDSAERHYKSALEWGSKPDPALEQLLNKQ
jgi:Flp pilus assembly protein TadD